MCGAVLLQLYKSELQWLVHVQVLHPQRAKALRDLLAQPQSRAGLAAALAQLKGRLDDMGLPYEDLSGQYLTPNLNRSIPRKCF